MKRNVVPLLSAAAVVAAFSTVVLAQEMKPDRAIKYRQGILQAVGWNMGVLGGMAKGEIPYDKDKAVRAATFVSELAAMAWDGFVPARTPARRPRPSRRSGRTRPSSTSWPRTCRPKPSKLVAAANSGDVASLRTALGPVGKACSNCHDDFRNK